MAQQPGWHQPTHGPMATAPPRYEVSCTLPLPPPRPTQQFLEIRHDSKQALHTPRLSFFVCVQMKPILRGMRGDDRKGEEGEGSQTEHSTNNVDTYTCICTTFKPPTHHVSFHQQAHSHTNPLNFFCATETFDERRMFNCTAEHGRICPTIPSVPVQ